LTGGSESPVGAGISMPYLRDRHEPLYIRGTIGRG
jgi:hypothetical protein